MAVGTGMRGAGPKVALLVVGPLMVVFLWIVTGAIATSAGPSVRAAALVYADESPAGSRLDYDDGSAEAAAFLGARDSVTAVVPWDMTTRAFLQLYHLENNRSAAEALEAIGSGDPESLLTEGTRLRFSLTPAQVLP